MPALAVPGVCQLHQSRKAWISLELLTKIRAEAGRLTDYLLRDGRILLDDPFIVGPISRIDGFLSGI